MDVVFVLDFSGSVEAYHTLVISFAREAISSLPIGQVARVAVVTFSDSASVSFYLDAYQSVIDAENALSFEPQGGTTNTQAALNLTNQVRANGHRRRHAGASQGTGPG